MCLLYLIYLQVLIAFKCITSPILRVSFPRSHSISVDCNVSAVDSEYNQEIPLVCLDGWLVWKLTATYYSETISRSW